MDNDKIERLLEYLKGFGFEGAQFEADIRDKCEQFDASFQIDHQVVFEGNRVDFRLRFIYDRQFDSYKFEGYQASMLIPVLMEHQVINDVDSHEVEEMMQGINWVHYFECEENELPFEKHMEPFFEIFWSLSDNDNEIGEEIQNRLIYKYWPENHWNERAYELSDEHQRAIEVNANETALPNTILAYHLLSGKLDELDKAITRTGIEQVKDIHIRELLAIYLQRFENFDLKAVIEKEAGILSYTFPVRYDARGYEAKEMEVSYTMYPEIKHGVFDGIESEELEQQMKLIDWDNDDLLYNIDMEKEEVFLFPYIETIKDKVFRLADFEGSKDLAEYLMVRYWSSTFMEAYVPDEVWKMKGWPTANQRFSLNENAKSVGNLLCGAPVHSTQLLSLEIKIDGWLKIDHTSICENGLSPIAFTPGISRAQIETMVNMLPLDGTQNIGEIVRLIRQGEKVTIDINALESKRQLVISAPENLGDQTLDIRTKEGLSIPVNFSLSPDWTPDKVDPIKQQNIRPSALNETPVGINKRKGKGYRK